MESSSYRPTILVFLVYTLIMTRGVLAAKRHHLVEVAYLQRGTKKLHPFIFIITLSNHIIFT